LRSSISPLSSPRSPVARASLSGARLSAIAARGGSIVVGKGLVAKSSQVKSPSYEVDRGPVDHDDEGAVRTPAESTVTATSDSLPRVMGTPMPPIHEALLAALLGAFLPASSLDEMGIAPNTPDVTPSKPWTMAGPAAAAGKEGEAAPLWALMLLDVLREYGPSIILPSPSLCVLAIRLLSSDAFLMCDDPGDGWWPAQLPSLPPIIAPVAYLQSTGELSTEDGECRAWY
jgi:hypothetical protein